VWRRAPDSPGRVVVRGSLVGYSCAVVEWTVGRRAWSPRRSPRAVLVLVVHRRGARPQPSGGDQLRERWVSDGRTDGADRVDSAAVAKYAGEKVEVDYAPLDPDLDMEAALREGATLVTPTWAPTGAPCPPKVAWGAGAASAPLWEVSDLR
jgi:hypothetical protein